MRHALTAMAATSALMVGIVCAPSAAEVKPARPNPVPFTLANQLILLDVRINGKGPFTFVLDTGAGATLLSPELASTLGLKRLGKKGNAVGAAGGKSDVSFGRVESISVGDVTAKNYEVAVLDLADVGKGAGKQLDGILGYTFLRHYRITIDYPKKIVLFEKDRK